MAYGTKYRTWGDYNRTKAAKRVKIAQSDAKIREQYIVDKYGRIIAPKQKADTK